MERRFPGDHCGTTSAEMPSPPTTPSPRARNSSPAISLLFRPSDQDSAASLKGKDTVSLSSAAASDQGLLKRCKQRLSSTTAGARLVFGKGSSLSVTSNQVEKDMDRVECGGSSFTSEIGGSGDVAHTSGPPGVGGSGNTRENSYGSMGFFNDLCEGKNF